MIEEVGEAVAEVVNDIYAGPLVPSFRDPSHALYQENIFFGKRELLMQTIAGSILVSHYIVHAAAPYLAYRHGDYYGVSFHDDIAHRGHACVCGGLGHTYLNL